MSRFCYCLSILLLSLGIIYSVYPVVQANDAQKEDCNGDVEKLNGSGSLPIPSENGCYIYIYNSTEKDSIVRVSVAATPSNETSKNSTDLAKRITVNLQEMTFKSGTDSYTTIHSWTLRPEKTFKDSYFSRNSQMRITFLVEGNWSRYDVILTHEEIPHQIYDKNSSKKERGEIKPWIPMDGRSYRPNCVYIFNITKSKSMTRSSIMITINYLNIDVEIGEYLLIGAGTGPFEGSRPHFITSVNGTKQYFVNDETAYIVFVAMSTRKNHTGFHITWEHTGTSIVKEKETSNDDVLQSVPICIYNIEAALAEFNKTQDRFKDFRENVSAVAKEYARNKSKEDVNIDSSRVSIFRISGVIRSASGKALYAMVKISKDTEDGKAAFEWRELEQIVDIYTQTYPQNDTSAYQFKKCPIREVPESWGNLGWFLIIPSICCIFLLVWTWKQNPLSEYFAKKKRRKRVSEAINTKYYQDDCATVNCATVTGNDYSSLPKVLRTDEHGRRFTMNLSDTLLSDADQSEDEIFNKMHTSRRRSDILESRRMKTSSTMFSSKQPEINLAFEIDEECRNELCRNDQIPEQEEKVEHMYDTVKSTNRLCEDEEVSETKL